MDGKKGLSPSPIPFSTSEFPVAKDTAINGTSYFAWLSQQDILVREKIVNSFIETIDSLNSIEVRQNYLLRLQSFREKFPKEFRWVFSALEIELDRVSAATEGDAEEALRDTNFVIKLTILGRERLTPAISYSVISNGQSEVVNLSFKNEHMLLRIYNNWVALPSRVDELANSSLWESERVKWIFFLTSKSFQFSLPVVRDLLSNFSHVNMRSFEDRKLKLDFYHQLRSLSSRLLRQYGSYDPSYRQRQLVVEGSQSEVFTEIKEKIKKWLSESPSFLVNN